MHGQTLLTHNSIGRYKMDNNSRNNARSRANNKCKCNSNQAKSNSSRAKSNARSK